MGNILKAIRKWFNVPKGHDSCKKSEIYTVDNPLTTTPVYSWDRKPRIDASQFRLSNITDQHVHRSLLLQDTENSTSGSHNQGQQLILENCFRSLITLSDGFSDSLFIDDCSECRIVLSPVKNSVFLRNCRECVVLVAGCGQFRTRDCSDVITYLHCASQPSIETSVRLQFNCISLNCPNLRELMVLAQLDPLVNLWSSVFDFTPMGGNQQETPNTNWRLLPTDDQVQDRFNEAELVHCARQGLTFSRSNSAVPYTHPALATSSDSKVNMGKDISDSFYNLVCENHRL